VEILTEKKLAWRTKPKLHTGHGINDYEYEITRHEINDDGKYVCVWTDPCYSIWKGLLARIYRPDTVKQARVYMGCSLYYDWHYLSKFQAWFSENWVEGWSLDKDILVYGNKIYGPDTCRFVPNYINNLFTGGGSTKGEQPIGVHKDRTPIAKNKPCKRFIARCSDSSNGRVYLGLFYTAKEAHKAWQEEKINQINNVIDRFRHEPIGYKVELEEALLKRIKMLQEDIDNGRETVKL